MLVLVLEFSRISATTLYPANNLRGPRNIVEREAPDGASFKERCRSSKTEDESPDLRSSHLTGTLIVRVRQGRSPVV
jgi:hypothetical protein